MLRGDSAFDYRYRTANCGRGIACTYVQCLSSGLDLAGIVSCPDLGSSPSSGEGEEPRSGHETIALLCE